MLYQGWVSRNLARIQLQGKGQLLIMRMLRTKLAVPYLAQATYRLKCRPSEAGWEP